MTVNSEVYMRKNEHLHTVAMNIHWYDLCETQHGSSSKSRIWSNLNDKQMLKCP